MSVSGMNNTVWEYGQCRKRGCNSCLRATKGCKELPFVLGCDASVGICQMTEEGVTWETASCVEVEVTQAFLKAPTMC